METLPFVLLSFGINPFLCSKDVASLARTHRLCRAARNYTTCIHDLALRHVPRLQLDLSAELRWMVWRSLMFCDEQDFIAYYTHAKERLDTALTDYWVLSQNRSVTVGRVFAMTQSIPHAMLRKELEEWSSTHSFTRPQCA
jgi:hypothetical protein